MNESCNRDVNIFWINCIKTTLEIFNLLRAVFGAYNVVQISVMRTLRKLKISRFVTL